MLAGDAGFRTEKHCYPLSPLYSHMVEPSGRGHRDGWEFGESCRFQQKWEDRPGLLWVPGRWEAGRVGAGSRARLGKCHRAGALVCSLAAENGGKDKVGATWVLLNPNPGVPLRSRSGKGKARIWVSGALLGLSKSQPPVLLWLLLLSAPSLTLFHVHAVSPWGPADARGQARTWWRPI